jgi:undecaprenyl diphosphate synthase
MHSGQQSGLHVAIIMDGNGRWATRRGLGRAAGHRAGAAVVRRIVEHAPDVGVGTLTLYAFSQENWRRPAFEVRSIFALLGIYLRLEREPMRQRGVRLEAIGRRDRLPRRLIREIEETEAATAAGRRLHLRVAIDYSSRDAIARAAAMALRGCAEGEGVPANGFFAARPQKHFERQAEGHLQEALTEALRSQGPEVDLVIRTGGEKRLSDFLLWESAYAELVFMDCMWPEFSTADLDAALGEFSRRERRFGGVSPDSVSRAEDAVPEPGWGTMTGTGD